MIISNIWENKTCSKPPTSYGYPNGTPNMPWIYGCFLSHGGTYPYSYHPPISNDGIFPQKPSSYGVRPWRAGKGSDPLVNWWIRRWPWRWPCSKVFFFFKCAIGCLSNSQTEKDIASKSQLTASVNANKNWWLHVNRNEMSRYIGSMMKSMEHSYQ